ncbi:uncharacterized protein LOC134711128 [Mytilus trossulus]|uniref:uncharacterized protein LOC134711128 n=1 Tax=Mytilus trossulus TaxID=6551 RepID=UPI0030065208
MERNGYVVALILLFFYTGQSKCFLSLFHGCFTGFDSNISFMSSYMSIEMCSKFCDEQHYTWAATSGHVDGDILDSHNVAKCCCSKEPAHTEINETFCNSPCPGNGNETCGGQNTTFVSMYSVVQDDNNHQDAINSKYNVMDKQNNQLNYAFDVVRLTYEQVSEVYVVLYVNR